MTQKTVTTNPVTLENAWGMYDMKLGDDTIVGPYRVTRVPGGWIFMAQTCVFVEFHNEFQPKMKH